MSDHASPLAEIRSYSELRNSLRQRADQLQVSRRTIDAMAGIADGLSEKLLGPSETKKFGILSLGALLGALGVKLIMVEDPAMMAEFARRNPPRRAECQVRHRATNGATQHV